MKFSLLIIASIALMTQAASITKDIEPRFPINGKIVGGVETSIEDIPYQVSLLRTSHFCGGSIISSRWILSAAHCVTNAQSSTLKIRVGSSSRLDGGSVLNVSTIISHPLYKAVGTDYDYALIELSEDMEFNSTAQPIALPDQDEEFEVGSECLVSGWGDTKRPSESSVKLRKVVVPIVDREHCKTAYGAKKITERMICAGFEQGGKDSCQGDSGGPLVHDDVLIGVVSWGRGCAEQHFPGVYANVAYVRDWIKEVSGV